MTYYESPPPAIRERRSKTVMSWSAYKQNMASVSSGRNPYREPVRRASLAANGISWNPYSGGDTNPLGAHDPYREPVRRESTSTSLNFYSDPTLTPSTSSQSPYREPTPRRSISTARNVHGNGAAPAHYRELTRRPSTTTLWSSWSPRSEDPAGPPALQRPYPEPVRRTAVDITWSSYEGSSQHPSSLRPPDEKYGHRPSVHTLRRVYEDGASVPPMPRAPNQQYPRRTTMASSWTPYRATRQASPERFPEETRANWDKRRYYARNGRPAPEPIYVTEHQLRPHGEETEYQHDQRGWEEPRRSETVERDGISSLSPPPTRRTLRKPVNKSERDRDEWSAGVKAQDQDYDDEYDSRQDDVHEDDDRRDHQHNDRREPRDRQRRNEEHRHQRHGDEQRGSDVHNGHQSPALPPPPPAPPLPPSFQTFVRKPAKANRENPQKADDDDALRADEVPTEDYWDESEPVARSTVNKDRSPAKLRQRDEDDSYSPSREGRGDIAASMKALGLTPKQRTQRQMSTGEQRQRIKQYE